MNQDRIKVLIAKPGLDGHEMGARLISRVLMDAGMEVVYTGPQQTADAVVLAAIHEDVDVIGLSFLSGSHKEHTSEIIRVMAEKGMNLDSTVLLVGGIIPIQDIPYLHSLGVDAVYGPGTDTRVIVNSIINAVHKKGGKDD